MDQANPPSLFQDAGKYLGGLARDEIIVAFILGAIGTTLFYFFMTHVLNRPTQLSHGKKWAVWVTMGVSVSAVALLAIDATRYFVTQTKAVTTQLNEIRSGIKNPPLPVNPSAIRGSVKKCIIGTNSIIPGFAVAMNLRLTNPGKPSNIWAWTLRVTLKGGQQFEYPVLDTLPGNIGFKDPTTNTDETVNKDNYLPIQLLEKTVGGDHGAVGWVIFQGRSIISSEITQAGTKFQVEFEQGDGTKRTIDYVWVDNTP